MKHPSKTHAARARKACILLKQVAHARGIELLDLYAPSRNEGRPDKFPIKHWPKTLAKNKRRNRMARKTRKPAGKPSGRRRPMGGKKSGRRR